MSTPEDTPPNPAPPPPNPTPGPLNWRRFVPTNWQSIVSTLAVTLLAMLLGALGIKAPVPVPPIPAPIWPDGWVIIEDPETKEQRAVATGWTAPSDEERDDALRSLNVYEWFETDASQVVGDDPTKDALLWKAAIKVSGKHIPTRNQGSVGSCVSFGFGTSMEYALAVQIAEKKGPPQELVDVVQEILYAGGRVEANGGRSALLGDGSTGAWQAKWFAMGGTLKRGVYGSIDITAYSASRARAWGRSGVPDELEPLAKQNTASCALVTSAEDARKALHQGYPIAVCSTQGFSNQRDAEGFASARGRWAHCMAIIGYRGDKRGYYIMNSWGENWISGPRGYGDPPPGGFWAEEGVIDRMLKQRDSYAISSVKGFPKQKINVDDWIANGQQHGPRFAPVIGLVP